MKQKAKTIDAGHGDQIAVGQDDFDGFAWKSAIVDP